MREHLVGRRSTTTTTWEATMVQFVFGLGIGIVGAVAVVRAGRVALRRR